MPTSKPRVATDAWTDSSRPDLNTNEEGKWLRIQDGTPTLRTYCHIKLPPRGAVINSAELRFFTAGSSGDTYSCHVQRITDPWTDSLIDDTNAPAVAGTISTISFTETAGAMLAFDIQALVQAACDGSAYHGFRLTTDDTSERKVWSSDALDNQPYAVISWSDDPDAPTELSPSGGSAVSIAKPTLLFNFHDPVGSDMAGMRIQIKATNSGWTDDPTTGGFASPDFDTGALASTDPEYDTSSGAYGGISVAATEYWTVQVQNAAGNWSKWSDPVHFTRIDRGVLTVGSPTGNVVHDATPTFIWSTTATQTSWHLEIFDDSDPGTTIYDSGRHSGTTSSHTLPKGVITDETVTYRYRLRIWEDLTRVSTPGDKIFTEAVDTFTFVEDPTPDAPTSVTVTQVANGQPHVQLDIVRSAAPDFFGIQRNGKWIDTDVDPTDIYLSGTTYRYKDRTAGPNRDWTYKVRAKVGGVQGPARTATPDPFSYKVREMWLMDWTNPGSDRLVPIQFDLSQCQFTMPQTGGTYSPVDGVNVVTVRQSIKGLSGTIVGKIVSGHQLAAADSVADMLWFKQHAPQNRLRMTLGNQNLEVEIDQVLISPTMVDGDPEARAVSFAFNSIGGPSQ